MNKGWWAEAEQFLADMDVLRNDNAKTRELLVSHTILKKAVSKFLACPFNKGENKFTLIIRCFDVHDLAEAYRMACYYDD